MSNFYKIEFTLGGHYIGHVFWPRTTSLTLEILGELLVEKNIDCQLRDCPLTFFWRDEQDDEIFIANDCELQEAVEAQTSEGLCTLRFYVTASERKTKKRRREEEAGKEEKGIKPLFELSVDEVACVFVNLELPLACAELVRERSLSGDLLCLVESEQDLRRYGLSQRLLESTHVGVLLQAVREMKEKGVSAKYLEAIKRDTQPFPPSTIAPLSDLVNRLQQTFDILQEQMKAKEALMDEKIDRLLAMQEKMEARTVSIEKKMSEFVDEMKAMKTTACQKMEHAQEPARWSLVYSPGLEALDVATDDLQKKICGAVWMDKFDNLVSCDLNLVPLLEIFAMDESTARLNSKEIVERFPPSHRILLQRGPVQMALKYPPSSHLLSDTQSSDKSSSAFPAKVPTFSTTPAQMGLSCQPPSELEGFVLPSSASFECLRGCEEILLRVVDDKHQLIASEPVVFRVMTKKSLPKQLLLSCEALGVKQPAREISVDVSRFSLINDLRIIVRDSNGDEPSLDNLSEMKIAVLDQSQREVFTADDVTSCVVYATLNYEFNAPESYATEKPAKEPSGVDRVVEFVCKMSYRSGTELVHLPPAYLHCHVKKLNYVVGLKMQAHKDVVHTNTLSQKLIASSEQEVKMRREGNLYSLSVPCDAKMPMFTLQVETEDGCPFLPVIESFKVSTKQRVGKEKSRVSFSYLFEYGIDEVNGELMFNPTDKFTTEILCVYELEIIYEEKRENLSAILPETMKRTKIQLHINIVPGALKKLSLDDSSLAKLKNRVVSFSDDPQQRFMGDCIRLQGKDIHDNITHFASTHEVRCRVVASVEEPVVNFRTDVPLPILRGADQLGFIRAVVDKNGDGCTFSKIELDRDRSELCREGEYFLRFSLGRKKGKTKTTSSDDSIDEGPIPLHIPFELTHGKTNPFKK